MLDNLIYNLHILILLVDKHREAAFGFFAGATGKHEMCFLNTNSASDKTVMFSFIGPDDQASIPTIKDASEHESQLGSSIVTLSNDMRYI